MVSFVWVRVGFSFSLEFFPFSDVRLVLSLSVFNRDPTLLDLDREFCLRLEVFLRSLKMSFALRSLSASNRRRVLGDFSLSLDLLSRRLGEFLGDLSLSLDLLLRRLGEFLDLERLWRVLTWVVEYSLELRSLLSTDNLRFFFDLDLDLELLRFPLEESSHSRVPFFFSSSLITDLGLRLL